MGEPGKNDRCWITLNPALFGRQSFPVQVSLFPDPVTHCFYSVRHFRDYRIAFGNGYRAIEDGKH